MTETFERLYESHLQEGEFDNVTKGLIQQNLTEFIEDVMACKSKLGQRRTVDMVGLIAKAFINGASLVAAGSTEKDARSLCRQAARAVGIELGDSFGGFE